MTHYCMCHVSWFPIPISHYECPLPNSQNHLPKNSSLPYHTNVYYLMSISLAWYLIHHTPNKLSDTHYPQYITPYITCNLISVLVTWYPFSDTHYPKVIDSSLIQIPSTWITLPNTLLPFTSFQTPSTLYAPHDTRHQIPSIHYLLHATW